MLKRHSIPTLVLFTDKQLVDSAKQQGLVAELFPVDDGVMIDLSDRPIVVAANENARELALGLVSQGVDAINVEYFDGAIAGTLEHLAKQPDGLRIVTDGARHVYWHDAHTLAEAQDDPDDVERYSSGYDFFDPHLKWRRRELVVAAGAYGCGKSILVQLLAIQWAIGAGGANALIPVWFCTWEDDPVEQKDQIVRFCNGDKAKALEIQNKILHTPPQWDGERLITWYMDRARYLHRKFGTNFFVLDPWSEFDHEKPSSESETAYVKVIMRALRKLSNELDAIFVIVTHISARMYPEDGSIKPFRVANAFGSVQFGSSCDRGICVMRTSKLGGPNDHMVVRFDKVKVERTMGRKGTLALSYNEDQHQLSLDGVATAQAQEAWK